MKLRLGIFKSFSFDDRRVVKSDTCREKPKGKREVCCRSDGRQELRSCIRSGISQAANGVHSAVVLYGLTFVFLLVCFFENEPSCTVLNSLQSNYLSRRQTGKDRVTVIKARGNQSGD